ncbi:phosphoribosylanthranilate isomerase [Calidifontibacillus oryziterrae]|uniref:phosphoribosylanthranilate isomerase n=1 Tax=Calidifontibacillus oryziterrae TaxID=1191699 RepID=UPI0002F99391|nr:phosphoribosylanthranilate isomerase [Calidifontibacillus oryziterrae]
MIDVKLCGNHSLEDLKYSFLSGVRYIGIVFAAESKRTVEPVECGNWLSQLEKHHYQQIVGVFVNPKEEEILDVLKYVPLQVLQFHGNETPQYIQKIKEITRLTVWKAIHHEQVTGLATMREFRGVVDGYVIDSKVKGEWGGTGQCFDWKAIPQYVEEGKRQGVPCLIAGGITADNVEKVVAYCPDGVDLASGIETEGHKDKNKITVLLERLKAK